jgi:hypothetical protein
MPVGEGEPKSCLGQVFNSKIGRFGKCIIYIPLELKTWPRFRPVCLSLSLCQFFNCFSLTTMFWQNKLHCLCPDLFNIELSNFGQLSTNLYANIPEHKANNFAIYFYQYFATICINSIRNTPNSSSQTEYHSYLVCNVL